MKEEKRNEAERDGGGPSCEGDDDASKIDLLSSHRCFVLVGKLRSDPRTNGSLVRVKTSIPAGPSSREDPECHHYSIETIEPNLPKSGSMQSGSIKSGPTKDFLLAAWDRNSGTIAVVSHEEEGEENSYWLRYGVAGGKTTETTAEKTVRGGGGLVATKTTATTAAGPPPPATRSEEKRVELPEMASSLCVMGNAVCLGFPNSVGWVDCSVENPSYREIYRRKHQESAATDREEEWEECYANKAFEEKAYEMFVRKGSMLVAVDDVMYPYYAEQFSLAMVLPDEKNDNNPNNNDSNRGDRHNAVAGISHNQTWTLPALINGSYRLVDVLPDNQLVLVSSGSYRTANYQNLDRIPISELQHPSRADFRTYCTETLRGAASLREHQKRDYRSGGKIVETHTLTEDSDNRMTRWQDMAVRGDEVYLAAGERGLLVVPGNFSGEGAGGSTTVSSVLQLEHDEAITSLRVLDDGGGDADSAEVWLTMEKKEGGTELLQIRYPSDREGSMASVTRKIKLPGSGFRLLKEGGACTMEHVDTESRSKQLRPARGWCCC